MDIRDIPTGESWGCRFRTTVFLDANGKPISAQNLQLGQAHPGEPGVYESIGVIQVRDLERELVQLQDIETFNQYTVSFDDIWDVDTIEWTNEE